MRYVGGGGWQEAFATLNVKEERFVYTCAYY